MLDTKCILVAGASGWLGKRLVKFLINELKNHCGTQCTNETTEIRCLDLSELQNTSERLKVYRGDITDKESLIPFFSGARDAILFHVAGVIHPKKPQEFFSINFKGSKNLLEAAVAAGVKRAIVMSSNSPCGCNERRDQLFDEQSPYNPYLSYGRSKMLMEEFVHELYASGKLETVIIRSPWFYGPDQPARQTLFFRMIRDGKMPIVGDGNNRRSMAYVDNICQGLLLAAQKPQAAGQTYWIADESPYTMNEIVKTVEQLLEKEFGQRCVHKQMRMPNFVGSAAYTIDNILQKIGMYNQKIHVLSEINKNIACSVSKAKKELDFKPEIALEEGMRRSLQWCQQQGFL